MPSSLSSCLKVVNILWVYRSIVKVNWNRFVCVSHFFSASQNVQNVWKFKTNKYNLFTNTFMPWCEKRIVIFIRPYGKSGFPGDGKVLVKTGLRESYLLLRRDAATAALYGLGEHCDVQRRRIFGRVSVRDFPGGSTSGRALDGCGQRSSVGQLIQDRVKQVIQKLVYVRRLRRHAYASDMGG